jgi:hypothetical protein
VVSRGYKVEERPQEAGVGVLEFVIDTASGSSSMLRMLVRNTGNKPVVLSKKIANLAIADTIISIAPFADGAYTEYSYHSASVFSSSTGNSTLGVNRYAINPSERLSSSASTNSTSSTNGTTVTSLPITEVVVFPKQVLSLVINSPIDELIGEGVTYSYRNDDGRRLTRRARLRNTSENEEIIDNDIEVLQRHYTSIGIDTYTLTMTYKILGEDKDYIASGSFGVRAIDIHKKVDKVD